ncbi:NTE family protein RssA [Pseudovibrio axinellae]|uniref:NTE family protein RssA n=1 Tax=Pseudovibrio axinellae TaxID=989403 RepID=A0A166AKS2_9HYPH|nr:patatin-like phospholipase family protein [Pseudovibrio axinellae]KZL21246.1 NTE family protein RssA [Pseudovibrio axinellae]SEQ93367.1 NTE family protein [Pseudovibrio axinellae]
MLPKISLWPTSRQPTEQDQEPETPSNAPDPEITPGIGLALGGGAARGWAHIGVLKALSEAGIQLDFIAGTSIGAVVGGCYLCGKLDQLEEWVLTLSRRRVFSMVDLSFGGSGLISGNKVLSLFEDHFGGIMIEDLDRPFAAVATELGTGHEIWLKNGPLAQAMRCTTSLPGVFEPVAYGGRWLVDGALVNPIPVSVCRAMGARAVIAINLNSDTFGRGSTVVHELPPIPKDMIPEIESRLLKDPGGTIKRVLRRQIFGGKPKALPGISGVMMDSYNIIQDRIGRSRLAGDPPDSILTLRLSHLGLFDFHRGEEAIRVGYETTCRALPELHQLAEMQP